MLKRLRKDEKGFTLVELIVVIAILAVLALLIVPRIVGNVDDANTQKEIANARTLASEITVYNATCKVASDKITGSPCSFAAYDAKLDLPSAVTWPKSEVVEILIDSKGNASINIKTPVSVSGT